MPKTTTGDRPELKPVNVGAAAIDIGSKMHMAAVNPACTDVPVRTFGTFTQDLHRLADWFKTCGVTSVAMESTGVYWIPVYEVLEQRGFEVILVNARYAKNVPGRKTDVSDAAWLRQLHSYGLLRGSFRHYLETEGVTLPNKQTLAPLWSETARHLRLSPGQLADDDLKQILAGLFSIAGGVAALRTHEGSAHGQANKNYKIEARHARLAAMHGSLLKTPIGLPSSAKAIIFSIACAVRTGRTCDEESHISLDTYSRQDIRTTSWLTAGACGRSETAMRYGTRPRYQLSL